MAENKNTQQVREITDKLEQGIKELFESEKFKEYLTTMSKFYNYSFNNTLLIAMPLLSPSLLVSSPRMTMAVTPPLAPIMLTTTMTAFATMTDAVLP